MELLDQGSYQAVNQAECIVKELEGIVPSEVLDQFGMCVGRFDFETAMDRILGIAHRLELPITEPS